MALQGRAPITERTQPVAHVTVEQTALQARAPVTNAVLFTSKSCVEWVDSRRCGLPTFSCTQVTVERILGRRKALITSLLSQQSSQSRHLIVLYAKFGASGRWEVQRSKEN